MSTSPLSIGLTLAERLNPSAARFQHLQSIIEQSLRVALPAVVQNFVPGPPTTVDVLVTTKEFVLWNTAGPDSSAPSLQTQAMRLPLLINLPVCVPSAGGWSVTFPIQVGDECLVIFGDTSLDAWLQSGGIDNVQVSQRRHDLSDGIAVFGLRSAPRGLTAWSQSSMQIRNDDASVVVDLAPNQITITSDQVTVNAKKVSVVSSDEVTVTAANKVTIKAAGNTKIEDRLFLQHIHTGVAAGPQTSGPVY